MATERSDPLKTGDSSSALRPHSAAGITPHSPPPPSRSFLFGAVFAVAAGLYGSLYCLWGDPWRGPAGLALSVLALSRRVAAGTDDAAPAQRKAGPLWPFALVIAALVFFRCDRLVPPGLWGDDAINGLLAFDVLDGHISSPFQLVRHSHSFFHALTNYAIAAAFRLFGPGPEALRLPGIAAGIIAGGALYAALVPLFGRRVACVAGLFFAASPLQISHSKNLIQEVLGLAFQCTGIAFLVGATTARGALGAAAKATAAAVAFAAAIYTYHAFKLAPLVALPYLAVVRGRGGASRDGRRTLATAAAVFALCLIPALLSYAHDPGKLTRRFTGVSLLGELSAAGSLRPLWESTWRTLAVFHYQQGPPRYHWFGIGDEPALDPIVAFLAVHGLFLSLRRWREPRHVLLLAWFAVGLIPGVFSTEAPRGYRILMATPPVYAWAALPVVALWRSGARGFAAMALRGLAAALVAGALFVDFNYYFYRTFTHPDFLWMQGERQVAMARALRRRGPGWRGYLLSPRFSAEYESLRFLSRAWGLRFADVAGLAEILPLKDPPPAGALFITTPGTHEVEELLRVFYPNATTESVFDPAPRSWYFGGDWPYRPKKPHREPVATMIAVPHDDLLRARNRGGPQWLPVVAEYLPRGGEPIRRREPPPFFNFFSDTFPAPFAARFSGAFFVPPPGGYTVEVRGEGAVETYLDGARVSERTALPSGRHHIEIRLPRVERRLRLAVWWSAPGRASTLVPAHAWRPTPFDEARHP